MEEKKYNRNFLISLVITLILMGFSLFIREAIVLNGSTFGFVGCLVGTFCTRVFKNSKYKITSSLILSVLILFVLLKGFFHIPAYIIIFTALFILIIDEAVKVKNEYMKIKILATVMLFICFFSFNYYLGSTRLIKSLNLSKAIVEQNYFIDGMDEITEETLQQVSKLTIRDEKFGITDLSGIQHLKNLNALSLEDYGIVKDYTPLQELKNLKRLRTWKVDLDKLEGLSEITSVEFLEISYPEKGYLDSLKSFPNLNTLTVQGGDLWDVKTLQGAKNLKKLTIADCKVIDFQGIEYFETLEELTLYELNIKDSSKLLTLKNLKFISIVDCKVQDMDTFKVKAEELGIIVRVSNSKEVS
ncbi:hypothetical protein [Clostridium sp.]|uniref:hypothetical protein n=1 Tax=Clostridium sp. TaxID=1506 RepID=UPI002FCC0347